MSSLSVADLFGVRGRVALVTGGCSGIGLMIAKGLVANGAKVYVTALSTDDIEGAVAELRELGKAAGGQAIGFASDLSTKEGISSIAKEIEKHDDHLDILCSNAGIRRDPPQMCNVKTASLDELQASLWSSNHSDWNDTFQVNVTAHYFLSVALLKLLVAASNLELGDGLRGRDVGRGVMIITSSCASMHNCTNVDLTSYAASKAAIDHLVALLATKFAKWYVRVNAINPGFVPSKMNPVEEGNNQFAELFKAMPAGRIGKLEDIAGAVIYLSSQAGQRTIADAGSWENLDEAMYLQRQNGGTTHDMEGLLLALYALSISLICSSIILLYLRKLFKMMTAVLLVASVLCGLVISNNLPPAPHGLKLRDVDAKDLYPGYNISVPVDHFHNDSRYEPHSDESFNLRYFFDAQYYKPGGPVIVLQSGETDATGRLPFLQKGIVAILAQATNGIGVVLEHRYYGTSFPTANLSTENFRFLTTDQAVADQAYFSSHVVFPGLEHLNLTAPGTAHIAYGGSYAGAVVAFLRKLYPEATWGAISSSGVTEAIYDYWEYYEPIRQYGPAECISTQVKLINFLDNILQKNNSNEVNRLKSAFGMENLTYSDDFAQVASGGIQNWQSNNWDPAVGSPQFGYYCGNITSDEILWPDYKNRSSTAAALIEAGGWGNESESLTNRALNWFAWTNNAYVPGCEDDLEECYGYHNSSAAKYTDKDISNYEQLSWAYQYCTEYGYIQTGSGVPDDQLPLVSRLLDLDYLTLVCRYAFNITSPPDLEAVNKYGGFNISYPRLAIIGGEADPWRPATPLASLDVPDRLNDTSTGSEPIILIPGGVHHWEENGLFANETTADLPPPSVVDAQRELVQAVQLWMAEWQQTQYYS